MIYYIKAKPYEAKERVTRMKVGVIGYGNLGRGVELAIKQNPDMELVGIFTRRDPKSVSAIRF